jgi:hypothetical protein
MALGDAVSVDQVDVVHSPCAVAACALAAQSATAAKTPPYASFLTLFIMTLLFTGTNYTKFSHRSARRGEGQRIVVTH